MLGGGQVLLGRYSRTEDVVSGTPLANRNQPELEGLIGYFVNPVALRTNLSGAHKGRGTPSTITAVAQNVGAPPESGHPQPTHPPGRPWSALC